MERKKELLVRVYLIFMGFVLFAGLIIAKVVKTTVVEGDKWQEKGKKTVKWIDVEGERGNIYDQNGNLLATSLPYFDINVDLVTSTDKNFYDNIGGLSYKLSKHFGKSAAEWKSELISQRRKGNRYYPLLKKVTKDELDLLEKFPLFNLGKYKGGLTYMRKTRRERPYRLLSKRTIGQDREESDKIGIESSYDAFLSGQTEKRLMRRLPGDTWIPVLDPSELLQKRGADVVTTLDMHIQDVVHNELEKVLVEHNAKKGVAIVMDVKTGGIKAISNLRANGKGDYDEIYNDAIGSRTEPGSTFKLISAMAMLESGKVNLDTEVGMFGGKKKFFDHYMYDSHRHGIQSGTFKKAFSISSNIGMGHTAYKIFGRNKEGWKAFHDALFKLGVMNKTGIDIAGEESPFIKNPTKRKKDDPSNWSGTTVPWMAHGYELKMSPLQILNYYNAVANGGKLMKPHLVSEIIDSDGTTKKINPKVLKENIASPSTILKAQELLRAVAESGTATSLNVEGLSFAGKTGTTKLKYWEGNEKSSYNASFAGYFPDKNPKYSIIVVVYEPEGKHYYGGRVAGPVFKNIMQRLSGYENRVVVDTPAEPRVLQANSGHKGDYKKVLEFIGLGYEDHSEGSWVELNAEGSAMAFNTSNIKKNIIPDLRGKGLRDAVFILEALGLEVDIEGVGKVYKQSLTPGKEIKTKKIAIYLK